MIVSDRHRDAGEMTVPRVYRPSSGPLSDGSKSPAAGTEVVAYLASGAVLDDEWLTTAPPLVTPTFYLEPYAPRLVAVDNLSDADSSARSVQEVLQVLDLDASSP